MSDAKKLTITELEALLESGEPVSILPDGSVVMEKACPAIGPPEPREPCVHEWKSYWCPKCKMLAVDEIARLKQRDEATEFWKGVYPEGLTAESVQNELHDLYFLIEQVPIVYQHVTGGRLSKIMYHANAVIGEHDDVCHESCVDKEDSETEVEDYKAARDEVLELLREYDALHKRAEVFETLTPKQVTALGEDATRIEAAVAAMLKKTSEAADA